MIVEQESNDSFIYKNDGKLNKNLFDLQSNVIIYSYFKYSI